MTAAAQGQILDQILAERARQDAQWGGPAHDDTHDLSDWMEFITLQVEKFAVGLIQRQERYLTTPDARERFVKIAALAVAALEAHERQQHPPVEVVPPVEREDGKTDKVIEP